MKALIQTVGIIFLFSLPLSLGAQTDDAMIETEAEAEDGVNGNLDADEFNPPVDIVMDIIRQAIKEDTGELSEEQAQNLDRLELVLERNIERMVEESLESEGFDRARWENRARRNTSGNLVPILGIIFVFGMPVMIVAIALYAQHRKRRQRNELIASFVENDREIPESLLEDNAVQSDKSHMSRGLVLTGTGLGIALALGLFLNLKFAAFGAIPLFIGLAHLGIWKLQKGEQPTEPQG